MWSATAASWRPTRRGRVERLKANRSTIFDPHVAAHGGRVFKLMGDGALVEFSSVIAAVNCALAIQEATEKAGTETAEARRIRYRIGINLGEVIVEGDDIYGEGCQRGRAASGACSGGRRSPLPRRPGSGRRQGPLRVRGYGRAYGEEHRATGPCVLCPCGCRAQRGPWRTKRSTFESCRSACCRSPT